MYSALFAAGVLIVGIPYCLSVAGQWLHGLPSLPGYKKYLEAISPRRVYNLTVALLDLLSYFRYTNLYIQWKACYRSLNEASCVKDIQFGKNENRLDVYFPTAKGFDKSARLPALIYVFGGGWESGSRTMYCLLAQQLANDLNVVVICTDYSLYPKPTIGDIVQQINRSLFQIKEPQLRSVIKKCTIVDMVQDLIDCIGWTRDHGHSYGIDKDKVTLMGHSCGAHLCALTAMYLAGENEEIEIDTTKQRELLSSLKGIIGLSGVYHINDHYRHETWRGIEYVSAMCRVMKGEENFDRYSPATYISTLTKESTSRLPPFVLLHGIKDKVVPVESSLRFSSALLVASVKETLHVLPDVDHTAIVMDLMDRNRSSYTTLHEHVRKELQNIYF
ncbi:uncharacterized protein LOC117973165 [Acipenser ruthenus]|uniref:uncharacterized protein LOC117409063 n=1 Tax=Acipenser ruthenus TaxID=7906 RepID=UPI00145B5069|nr:uncharacterized protein LOC117409063 [Acipenser ruthenus]XP_058875346.1 uncharacterized protein LOC117973165 [Acipenser ruthenus]